MKVNKRAVFCVAILMVSVLCFPQISKKEKNHIKSSGDSYYKSRIGFGVFALIDSANYYSATNPNKALDFVEQALDLSIRLKNQKAEAYCYVSLGNINYTLSQYDLAISNYGNSVRILNDKRSYDPIVLGNVFKNTGRCFEEKKDYEKSLEYYEMAYELAKSSKSDIDDIEIKKLIANTYFLTGKYELSIKTYKEILLINSVLNNEQEKIDINNRIADNYLKTKQNTQALQYYGTSNTIATDINDYSQTSNSLTNISNVYRAQGNYDEEIKTRKQSLEINILNNDIPSQINTNRELGNTFYEQDKTEDAIEYLKKSVDLARTSDDLDALGKSLNSLSIAYKKVGDNEKALSTFKEYINIYDEIFKQKEKEVIAIGEYRSSLNSKQNRIEFLEREKKITERNIEILLKEQSIKAKENKAQRVWIYSLIITIFVSLGAFYLIYKSSKQKKIANQLLALKSLRSQMNPHFIFNALNSVNSFISNSDEKSANKYLSDFSKLMRAVMENSKHDLVPLSSEIEILTLYIDLEHFRFKDKFDYSFSVDDEIDIDAFEIPPMLIQPYIENAVWHGLRYKDDKGKLDVVINRKNNHLEVVIQDNGIGRKKSEEIKTKNQRESISTGMQNIQNRLKIINELNKTNLSVKVEDLDKEEQTGTKVTISIFNKINKES